LWYGHPLTRETGIAQTVAEAEDEEEEEEE
jgi:hypothetical protein